MRCLFEKRLAGRSAGARTGSLLGAELGSALGASVSPSVSVATTLVITCTMSCRTCTYQTDIVWLFPTVISANQIHVHGSEPADFHVVV